MEEGEENLFLPNDIKSHENVISPDKSSVEDKTIFKHLDKLEGKLNGY